MQSFTPQSISDWAAPSNPGLSLPKARLDAFKNNPFYAPRFHNRFLYFTSINDIAQEFGLCFRIDMAI